MKKPYAIIFLIALSASTTKAAMYSCANPDGGRTISNIPCKQINKDGTLKKNTYNKIFLTKPKPKVIKKVKKYYKTVPSRRDYSNTQYTEQCKEAAAYLWIFNLGILHGDHTNSKHQKYYRISQSASGVAVRMFCKEKSGEIFGAMLLYASKKKKPEWLRNNISKAIRQLNAK